MKLIALLAPTQIEFALVNPKNLVDWVFIGLASSNLSKGVLKNSKLNDHPKYIVILIGITS